MMWCFFSMINILYDYILLHSLISSGNGHLVRGKNHCLEFSPLPDKSRQENGFSDNDDDLMIVSQPCAQDSGNNMENRIAVCQITTKSLILFEDVDTIFDEDRGFIGAILQLAETSKRPIILTANCEFVIDVYYKS